MIATIPLTPEEVQFTVPLNKVTYMFTLLYNERDNLWTLSITDVSNNTTLGTSIGVVSGVDLLRPFAYGIGGLYVTALSGDRSDPTKSGLGTLHKMVYVSPDEPKSDAFLFS